MAPLLVIITPCSPLEYPIKRFAESIQINKYCISALLANASAFVPSASFTVIAN